MRTQIHPTAKEATPFVGYVQLPARSVARINPTNYHEVMAEILRTATGLTAAIEVASWYAHGRPEPPPPLAEVIYIECVVCGKSVERTSPNQKKCARCRQEGRVWIPAPMTCANPECRIVFDPRSPKHHYCTTACYRRFQKELRIKEKANESL